MKIERPRFELSRVYSDGVQEEPEIISVGQMPWDTKMERRGFLGVGVGVASLLLLLECKPIEPTDNVPLRVPDKSLNAHITGVLEVAISPDGKILASTDGTVKLWSLPDGKLLATFAGSTLESFAISPDGKILASASASIGDKTIKLMSLPDLKLLATLEGHNKNNVNCLAISPDGKILASSTLSEDDYTIKLWSVLDTKLLTTLEGHKNFVRGLTMSPHGKILASTSGDKTIKLWSLPDAKLLVTLNDHKDTVAIAISPDGKTLASGSSLTGTITLWSLPEGKPLATLEGHKASVDKLAISPDGTILASGSSDAIKLWSLPGGKLLATLSGSSHKAFAISPDGKFLVSGTDSDYTIKFWSLPEVKPLAALDGHKFSIAALAISPDGKILASGDSSGVVILWDLEKRAFLSFLFDPKVSQTDAISYNAFDEITGRTITYTLPCGSPIPPGAVCTCNCIPGTYKPPPSTIFDNDCICNKVCTCIPVPSDRDVKESFETKDATAILQKLSEIPIQKWNYKWDDSSIRHIGPMAQDFAKAFEVGEDDKHIHPVDAQGVAFAAIQGLFQMLKEKEAETENLRTKLQLQQKDNRSIRTRIEDLEKLVKEKFE